MREDASMIEADATLTPMSQAAGPQKAAPCQRIWVARTATLLLRLAFGLPVRLLWDCYYGAGYLVRYAKGVENGIEIWV